MLVIVCQYVDSPHLSITYWGDDFKKCKRIADHYASCPEMKVRFARVMNVYDLPQFIMDNIKDCNLYYD